MDIDGTTVVVGAWSDDTEGDNAGSAWVFSIPEDPPAVLMPTSQLVPSELSAGDYFGWANPTLGPMENLSTIVKEAQRIGVPRTLAPFRCDNGDYYCCDQNGRVVIWDHNTGSIEPDATYQWTSFL